MSAGNPVVRLHLVRPASSDSLNIRLWENLGRLEPGVHELYAGPVELDGITEVVADGCGFWNSCSGCYETEDGHPVGSYAYSAVMQCELGSGCSECGGLGAVWDNTDWDEVARQEGLDDGVEDGDDV